MRVSTERDEQAGIHGGWEGPVPRAALQTVPLYVPKPPQPRVGAESHRLFLNENPYPPLPSVIAVIAGAAAEINRYPEIAPTQLVARLAKHLDVPECHVVTGPGIMGIYQQISQAVLRPGDEIIYAWPSFEAYPIVTNVADCVAREVPLLGGRHDLAAMAAQVTTRTRAVFICNPNNPTGTVVSGSELEAFVADLPKTVLVVIDEAYAEFIPDHRGPSGVDLYRKHQNVVVLRTFSKAYGLAGLRVGYGLAHELLADAFRKCAVPCGVSSIAVAAALKSLTLEDELFERVRKISLERDRLWKVLGVLGIDTPPSGANFLWLGVGSAAATLSAQLEAEGVMARLISGHGIRLTVGNERSNSHVEQVLTTIMAA
ncbi:histidinol-phosphate transaminase [Mycobacteroides sp. LB1]|uniref:histidinol-phosphate transaminase n=1 Tax=Mycobacteroides sp. LB1 TaxID=2750814 RepID=UPI001C5F6B09